MVYGSSLENWRGRKLTVSSNLTPSAIANWQKRGRSPLGLNDSGFAEGVVSLTCRIRLGVANDHMVDEVDADYP